MNWASEIVAIILHTAVAKMNMLTGDLTALSFMNAKSSKTFDPRLALNMTIAYNVKNLSIVQFEGD